MSAATAAVAKMPGKSSSISVKILLRWNHTATIGGGAIPMAGAFRDRRIRSGKVKADQIRATGASICITPCHNCYDQIRDLDKEYELGIKVLSFKEMFEEALIIPEELKAKEEDEEE
jgi:hypothetical protein